MDTIGSFDGVYRFLSNFYPAPVTALGRTYATVEHAFQALKSRDPDGIILAAKTPGEAKRLGRMLVMRHDWNDMRVEVMRALLAQKFVAGRRDGHTGKFTLGDKLIATGEAVLIEGNTWNDVFWGVCNNTGENMLGRLLMERRSILRGTQAETAHQQWTL